MGEGGVVIKQTEPLTLIFSSVQLPGMAVGGDGNGRRVSFFFKRTPENAESGKDGLHYGIVTDTMTLEEWASTFERMGKQLRSGGML